MPSRIPAEKPLKREWLPSHRRRSSLRPESLLARKDPCGRRQSAKGEGGMRGSVEERSNQQFQRGLDELRAASNNAPVAAAGGASDFLTKSVDFDALKDRLRQLPSAAAK